MSESLEVIAAPPQNGRVRAGTRLLSVGDLAALPSPHYLVKDFVRAAGFNVLYGPSGSAKSFLAIDWSLCIATGLPFYGQAVEQGTVIYIAAEGASGLYVRLDAWQQARGADARSFYVFPEAVNFFAGETAGLVTEIERLDEKPVLIVVDTAARCLVGGEENSAKDVGMFIDRVDSLCATYSAASLIVHHTGKAGDLERGSSAFRGAADTMVSLKPEGAGLKLTCEKQKDAAEFEPWRLHLAEHADSCLIRPGTVPGRLAPAETQILETVRASFGTDWTSTTKIVEVSGVGKSSVYAAIKTLVSRGFIAEEQVDARSRRLRLTEEGETFLNRPEASDRTVPNLPSNTPPLGGWKETVGS